METETTIEEKTQASEAAPESAATTVSKAELEAAEAALAVMPDEDESGTEQLATKKDRLIGDVTAERAIRRELRTANAQLVAENAALRAAPAKEAEPSPLDAFAKEHPDDMVPGSVFQAQEKWRDARHSQSSKETEKARQGQADRQRGADALARAEAAYSDFHEITEAAEELLTEGDLVDIRKSKAPEVLLYKKSIARILEAGGATADKLRVRLKSKKTKVESDSVKTKASKTEDGSEDEDQNAPKHRNVHTARLHDVLG